MEFGPKCAVRLTDDNGRHAVDNNPRLSLNRGLANWGVNPRRWNRPLVLKGSYDVKATVVMFYTIVKFIAILQYFCAVLQRTW